MSMSKCSSTVFTVNGRVGLVELGITFGSPQTRMMSGACPPPAPSEWYVCTERPRKAPSVSSTHPASLSVSVWIVTCTSWASATPRQQSMAAGVVPQSSCNFSPTAPASMTSSRPSGRDVLPLPVNPKLRGRPSVAWSIIRKCCGPGVQVVAREPSAGPVPPPSRVVIPEAMASSASCGQMKWTCVSTPPAVSRLPSPAYTSVFTPITMPSDTPAIVSGFPAFPIPEILPALMPTSALKTPV
mmetsp:Transcript_10760/g.30227  ORF Transcript_10760/g.30227 Transcript_10760/m.30227 type:complete len:242 (+) Transcript_10760:880-1605(+)